jgi:myo-inositol-1-phosphate synthase
MSKIKVAIIGVGNCASSLVQGVKYYKNAKDKDFIPGLMHVNLGGYQIKDIEFSAAFDIDKDKVGKDLSEAIYTKPNNAAVFAKVPRLGVKVHRGMTHDGLGKYVSKIVKKAPGKTDDVAGILRKTKTDVVINYLPVGSEEATKWYVEQVLNAGCAFINCVPVFIAREEYWQTRFKKKGLPIIGDDIKSQVGATILHRILTNLFLDRGMPVDHTYQLNTGGNTDFLNMKEEERLTSKKISKTNAVVSQIQNRGMAIDKDDVHIGPSDYVPWQKDNKLCFLRIESRHFGDLPMNLECRLSVEDSPNSAGVVIDAVRCAKLALDNGISGALLGPSAYFKKSPPVQYDDNTAREMVEDFIATYGKPKKKKARAKRVKGKKKGTKG